MNDLKKALPHLVTMITVTAASVVLATQHLISGGEAVGMISLASGFTLGGTVASGSISTAASAAVDVSHSGSTPVTTSETPSSSSPATTSTVS